MEWTAIPSGLYLYPGMLRFMMIAMSFLNNVDIARADRTTSEGVTPQAILKAALILFAAVLGAWGWWKSPDVRRLLWSFPGLMFCLLGMWYAISAPTSIVFNVSFMATVLYWGTIPFILSGIRYVGGTRWMLDICIGQFLFLIFSVGLYFFDPSMAIVTEVLGPNYQVQRFGGLGHPNVVGRIAVFLGLLLFAGAVQRSISWFWLLICLPLIVGVAWASLSRTPVIAAAIAILIVLLPTLRVPHILYLCGYGAAALLAGVVVVEATFGWEPILEDVVLSRTKTGSMEELTTMTGRTEIWRFAWEKVLLSPIVGYGAGSTPVLMASHSGHAHNILLQPMVSIGIPGGLLFAVILMWNVYSALKYNIPLLQMCTVFILTLGIAETPLFNPLPESVTLMWFVISFWPIGQQFDAPIAATFRRLEEENAISPATLQEIEA